MLRPSILALTLLVITAMGPVHASTQTITFSKSVSFDGITASVSGMLTIDTTAKTVVGTITLTVVNTTSGQTIFSKTININAILPSSDAVRLVVGALTLAVSCSVDASTSSSVCMMSGNPDINRNGSVDIIDAAVLGFSYGSTVGGLRFNPAADLNANGKVDIFDAAILGADYGLQVLQ